MKTIERVGEFIEYKDLSFRSFEIAISITQNTIQTAVKRKSSLKDETLNKILQAYPELNPIWLLTGKGSMLIADESRQVTEAKEPNIEYGKKSRDLGELDRLFDRTKKLEDRLKAAEEEKLSSGDKVEQLEKIVNDQMALIEKLQFNVDRHEDYLKAISKGMLSRDVKAKDETGKESSEPKGKVG